MPIFTAAAAALVGTTALTGIGATIATSVLAAGLAAGTGHLLGVFDTPEGPSYSDPGVDQRSRANTQNKLPALYGSFMTRGIEMYQAVTEDRTQLYTVIALGEGPITRIDRILWDDITLTLGSDGVVTGATDVDGNAVDRLNGLIQVEQFLGNETGNFDSNLSSVFPEWTVNHRMSRIAYVTVRVTYSPDNDVRSLNDMRFIGTAPISNPAQAVRDQLQNTRYGLGLADGALDLTSFSEVESYYNELVASENSQGQTVMLPRYQVNGVIGTEANVENRVNTILVSCNSSLRWSNGRYSIFVNRQDAVEGFSVTEDNLIGSVEVTEQGMNNLLNKLVIRFGRDEANNWQPQETILETPAANRLPNEPDRERQLTLPLTATAVEAERVGLIILNESREQLIISHMLDVTAMPLEAGDVISYNLPDYGFVNKPFRITRISELEVEGGLQYEVEAIEYADAVYTEQMHIEPGASPNTSLPAADEIRAVNDLAIATRLETSTAPSFDLTWTVPSNSLISQFDIYINSTQGGFNQANTSFLQSIRPSGSADLYVSGDSISHTVTGITAGNYHLWVVGRNNSATSPESNTAILNNWNPQIIAGQQIIRHHDNPVTTDPNAPSGPTGNDVGWYDPREGTSNTTNVPADPNPHWEAITISSPIGAETRSLRFDLLGTAGAVDINSVDVNQQLDFTFSGVQGFNRVLAPARPTMTDFTFSGQAADAVPITAGQPERWRIQSNGGTSDPTADATGRNGRYFVSGNTFASTDRVTDTHTRFGAPAAGFSSPQTTEVGTATLHSEADGRVRLIMTTSTSFDPRVTAADVPWVGIFQSISSLDSTNDVFVQIGYTNSSGTSRTISANMDGVDIRVTGGFNEDNSPTFLDLTFSTQSGLSLPDADDDIEGPITFSITYYHPFLTPNPGVRISLTAPGGTINGNSTENVDIRVPHGISSSTTIRNTIGNSNLSGRLTVRLNDVDYVIRTDEAINQRVSGNAILLDALELPDGSGDFFDFTVEVIPLGVDAIRSPLSISNPSFSPGGPATVSTLVTLNYGNNFNPLTQTVDLGSATSILTIAERIRDVIDDHPSFTATRSLGLVTVETVQLAPFPDDITLTVTRAGTTSSVPTFTVSNAGTGQVPVFEGRPTEYIIAQGNDELFRGNFSAAASSFDAASTVAAAIDNLLEYTGSTPFPAVARGTTVDNLADTGLTVDIITGVNDSTATSTNNLSVARTITQQGRQTELTGGTNASIDVLIGDVSIGTYDPMEQSISDIISGLDSLITADGRYTVTNVSPILRADSTFTGNSPVMSIVIDPGISAVLNADGSVNETAGTLAVNLNVVESGVIDTITAGAFGSFTIFSNSEIIAGGNFESGASASDVVAVLANALATSIRNYEITTEGNSVFATSTFLDSMPDIDISIVPGRDIMNNIATLELTKIIMREGDQGIIDLTNAEWTYYIINQEVRVDGDTTAMNPNNAITIPTGLVVDSEQIQTQGNTAIITAAETYSTAAHRSNLVITGGVAEPLLITNTGTDTRQYAIDWSLDGDVWTQFYVTQAFNPNFGGTANGQIFNNVQFIGGNILDVPASSTVHFRGRRLGGVAAIGSYGLGILVIEERNVDMTT